MVKRMVSLVLIMSLLVVFCVPVAAVSENGFGQTQNDMTSYVNDAKYHFYFDNEQYYDVYDIETCIEAFLYMKELYNNIVLEDNLIQIMIEFADDYTETTEYQNKREALYTSKSRNQERKVKEELRSKVKDFHKERNKENIELLESLNVQDIKEIAYSPFVQLKMDIHDIDIYQIIEISQNKKVKSISFSFGYDTVSRDSWDIMLEELAATTIIGQQTFTAEGVKVGILEEGVCHPQTSNLQNTEITYRDTNYSVHASYVASIIALMAPGVELFVSNTSHEIGVGWFLEQGCDVVNCSFSYEFFIENNDGTITYLAPVYRVDYDGVLDYQVKTAHISVVVAAGNQSEKNPNNAVTSPGLAYNVITVGGLKQETSLLRERLEYDERACYVSSVPYVKPEVSAMYTVDVLNLGTFAGTSAAAPQVTACIAILLGKYPAYFSNSPAEIKALLMATAVKTDDYVADRGNFDDRVGAGCVNLSAIMSNWSRTREYTVPAGSVAGTEIASLSIGLPAGKEIQVSLAWLMHVDSVHNVGYLTNYNICIYNSSGTMVAQSAIAGFSNVEMLRYPVPTGGTYRIVVYQGDNMNVNVPGEKIYLAYSLT